MTGACGSSGFSQLSEGYKMNSGIGHNMGIKFSEHGTRQKSTGDDWSSGIELPVI